MELRTMTLILITKVIEMQREILKPINKTTINNDNNKFKRNVIKIEYIFAFHPYLYFVKFKEVNKGKPNK